MFYKRIFADATTWRQIIKIVDVNICEVLNGLKDVSELYYEIRKIYLTYFPQMPRKCPIEPAAYSVNISTATFEDRATDLVAPLVGKGNRFPNGHYRIALKLSNKKDPIGCTFMIQIHQNKNKGVQFLSIV